MLNLGAAGTVRGVAGTGAVITATLVGMQLNAGVETYDVLAQAQLASSVGLLYTSPGSTTTFLESIVLANTSASPVSGIILYLNGSATVNQLNGALTIPANGTAVWVNNAGIKVYDGNGNLQTTIPVAATAANLTGTPALPNGTTATTQSPLSANTTLATTAYTDAAVAAYTATASTIFQSTVNLGSLPTSGGTFIITGTGFPSGQQATVWLSGGPQGDDAEMDQITASGVALNSTQLQVNWGSRTLVVGSYTFNYRF